MGRFIVIGSGLVLAAGALTTAAVSGQQDPQARVRVVRPAVTIVSDDDAQDTKIRKLAVLGGRGVEIGVSIRDLDVEQLTTMSGALVEDVREASPAEKAGIKKGDVIVEFDGERVRSARHLSRLVGETVEGRTVKAAVTREGKRVDLQVAPTSAMARLGDEMEIMVPKMFGGNMREFQFEGFPRMDLSERGGLGKDLEEFHWKDGDDAFELFKTRSRGRLGVGIQNLTPELAEYFGTKGGVLVTGVKPDSPAAKAGLKAGDVITSVNDVTVASPEDLTREVRKAADGAGVSIGYTRDKKAATAKATLEVPEKKEPRPRRSVQPV
jgi:membrane-associated protease RseP (regulator of RpoE activity)